MAAKKWLIGLVVSISIPIPLHAQALETSTRNSKSLGSIRQAYGESRDSEAVVLADRAILTSTETPEDLAEIHFWRGAALRRLGRHEEALLALKAAASIGYRAPEVRMETALAMAGAGRRQEAEEEMDRLRLLLQDDPRRSGDFEDRWTSRDEGARSFEVRLRPEAGYDSNLFSVSDDALLLTDQETESSYYGAVLSGRWWLLDGRRSPLAWSLEYQNTLRAYSEESELSYSDNVLSSTIRMPLSEVVDFELRPSLSHAFLAEDQEHLRTQRAVAPALLVKIPPAMVRLWGEWSHYDSYQDSTAVQDRDALSQRAGLSIAFDLGAGWGVSPFVSYLDQESEGSDYVHTVWEPGLAVSTPRIAGIRLALRGAYGLARFDNPDSLTGFTEEREDRRLTASLSVVFESLEKVAGYSPGITLTLQDWKSNIDAYDFRRIDARLEVSFLALAF